MINLDSFNLEGKVAVVTGGNMGLGMAYAEALCNLGADIVIPAYDPNVEEIKAFVLARGKKFFSYQIDLTKREGIQPMVDAIMNEMGRIDILVNNAGTILREPVLEHSAQNWDTVINLNLNSVFFLSQIVGRIMKEQGSGKIINIASMLSFQGGKFVPGYAASKHGVAGLTKSFANELAEFNIQVNAIAPGYINTANTHDIRHDPIRNNEILSRIPAGYWAMPEDIAGAVCFLASDAAKYINGAVIPVDGGWQAR